MTPRTVNIVCAKAPRRIGCVPAVLAASYEHERRADVWRCSYCGARVKVVA